MGAECCLSDVPTHGPVSAGGSADALGLGVSLGGLVGGEEERRCGRTGKTLCGYRETLAAKAVVGSYLANPGKGSGSLSWWSQPSCLACRGRGEGCGGQALPIPCSGCPGGWAACQPACGELIPFSVGGSNLAAHESCEIQPCVGTGGA